MKKYYIILGIVAVLLVLRFGVIPKLSNTQVAAPSCSVTTLKNLSENASLIVIGKAVSERVQTHNFFDRGTIFTYTAIGDIDVMKGSLTGATLEAKQTGGCDLLTGYCVYTSVMSPFEIDKKYLLFLRPATKYQPTPAEPPPASFGEKETKKLGEIEEGIYSGFSGCGGKYLLSGAISSAEIKEIILSGDEARWQTFLGTLSRGETQDNVSPQPTASPGIER